MEKLQAKTFVLPPGWEKQDKVATDLDCSREKVRSVLAPAIKLGDVECKQFVVFDKELKKLVRVTAYKMHDKG